MRICTVDQLVKSLVQFPLLATAAQGEEREHLCIPFGFLACNGFGKTSHLGQCVAQDVVKSVAMRD